MDNYTSNSSKAYVLEVDLEYPKEPQGLHNDYPLTPDKKKMLSKYQLKIADLHNIPTGNVKESVPIFLIKKLMYFIMKT